MKTFAEIQAEGTFYWYVGGTTLENRDTLRLDRDLDFSNPRGRDLPRLFIHRYLYLSDYLDSTGTAALSNVDAFRDTFFEWQGLLWWAVQDGSSSAIAGIAVRADLDAVAQASSDKVTENILGTDYDSAPARHRALADAALAMIDVLGRLDQYPILDQTAVARLESDLQADQIGLAIVDNHFPGLFYRALAEWGSTSAAAQLALLEDDPDIVADAVPDFETVYYALADLFGVQPTVGGTSSNPTVHFHFREWLAEFNRALGGLTFLADATLQLPPTSALDIMVSTIVAPSLMASSREGERILATSFRRGGALYAMVDAGLRFSRANAARRAVIADDIMGRGLSLASPYSYSKIRFDNF